MGALFSRLHKRNRRRKAEPEFVVAVRTRENSVSSSLIARFSKTPYELPEPEFDSFQRAVASLVYQPEETEAARAVEPPAPRAEDTTAPRAAEASTPQTEETTPVPDVVPPAPLAGETKTTPTTEPPVPVEGTETLLARASFMKTNRAGY